MNREEGWLIPEYSEPWLYWAFGTKKVNWRNEANSFVKQVHGDRVIPVREPGFAGEGDALITQTPGIILCIKTADCLPILIADPQQRAVAAIHAGWRGTVQGIAAATVSEMGRHYGTKPEDIVAAMGPAIGRCCFEVGPEVARQFGDFDPALRDATGKQRLDLQAINAWQLERAGVAHRNILRGNQCTVCDEESFWSFRREGERAGRMWSVVGVKGQIPDESPGPETAD